MFFLFMSCLQSAYLLFYLSFYRSCHLLPLHSFPTRRSSDLSPLLAPGVAAEIGDAIVRIDGREVGDEGVDPLLIGSADRPTELVLERDGSQRRGAGTPVASDGQLRYQAWGAPRRGTAAARSGARHGSLPLLHIV